MTTMTTSTKPQIEYKKWYEDIPLEKITWWQGIKKFPIWYKDYGKRSNTSDVTSFVLLPYVYITLIMNVVKFTTFFLIGLWCVKIEFSWNKVMSPYFSVGFAFEWPFPIYTWGGNDDGTKFLIRKSYWDFYYGY